MSEKQGCEVGRWWSLLSWMLERISVVCSSTLIMRFRSSGSTVKNSSKWGLAWAVESLPLYYLSTVLATAYRNWRRRMTFSGKRFPNARQGGIGDGRGIERSEKRQ
jgi:hypothetical protein